MAFIFAVTFAVTLRLRSGGLWLRPRCLRLRGLLVLRLRRRPLATRLLWRP